ncbi:Threonine-phosphate decarboxylase [Bienertia sinuspersici]
MELKKVLIRCYGVLKVIWSLGSCFEAVREALPYDTTVVVLQCLKELILTNLHDFTGLIKEGVFLQQETCHCKSLNGNLDNLQELEVEGCEELEQIFAFHDDDDDGVGQEGIINLEGHDGKRSDLTRLPYLRVLQLRCLLKLISIYPAGYLGKGSIE